MRLLLSVLLGLCLAWPAFAKGTGLIFVSLERGNEVVVLNPDLSVKARIETSRRPRDMRFNEAHTFLYVACGDDDVIDVIDVATLQVVDSIPTGPSPEIFVFSPDETQIFVSNEEDSNLTYPAMIRSVGLAPSQYGTKSMLGEKFADIEEKYDLTQAGDGFGEKDEEGKDVGSEEEEYGTDEEE